MANYQKSKSTASTKSEARKSSVTHGTITESILIKKTRLYLNSETQISPEGRPFRLSATTVNGKVPAKWIDDMLMHHHFHKFRYLDDYDRFFEIECDYLKKYIPNSLRKI